MLNTKTKQSEEQAERIADAQTRVLAIWRNINITNVTMSTGHRCLKSLSIGKVVTFSLGQTSYLPQVLSQFSATAQSSYYRCT